MMTAPARRTVDELAATLGVEAIPLSWRLHWQDFLDWQTAPRFESVRWEVPAISRELFDLPDAVIPVLQSAMREIAANADLAQLAGLWFYLAYELKTPIDDNSNHWTLPDSIRGMPVRLLWLAVLVAGTERANANADSSAVDVSICRASLAFIGQRVREVREKRGVWGVESFSFLRHYVRAELFRLGRLTFRVSPYPWPFRILRHRTSGQMAALCSEAGRFRQDGLADGTNGRFDADAWRATPCTIGETEITGTPVDENGVCRREVAHLPRRDWMQLCEPGDLRIEVHIAGGRKLDPIDCAASYRAAMDLFAKRHPHERLSGFTCLSWLLDPVFRHLLLAESNIVRFAKPYRLLAMPGDERQAYDLIYADPDADPVRYVATRSSTSLQRAIAGHVAAGGKIRAVAGFMPWDVAETLAPRN